MQWIVPGVAVSGTWSTAIGRSAFSRTGSGPPLARTSSSDSSNGITSSPREWRMTVPGFTVLAKPHAEIISFLGRRYRLHNRPAEGGAEAGSKPASAPTGKAGRLRGGNAAADRKTRTDETNCTETPCTEVRRRGFFHPVPPTWWPVFRRRCVAGFEAPNDSGPGTLPSEEPGCSVGSR